ncbi:AAA domain-containing protein [Chitinophaga arvensicola]|uniref:Part of AAA domain-containing protein n=1 Tax=Chitinophaga arvensicola TaxID=29529 RepID=A0A1I0SD20_9BACT|nr:AAA domain-containing protein [Chitinophaga arvensicola]SEW53816.1 Part of AAA domain-containing protein [Chitinophaga arvensicola]
MPPPDNPGNVLSSWIALEVLSPQTFTDPRDLVSGSYSSIVPIGVTPLPWEGEEGPVKPNFRAYYQVILDTIYFDKAIHSLLEIYADKRPERPGVKGEAIMATVIVDDKGRPCREPAGNISSFGWGLKPALDRDLKRLSEWSAAEKKWSEELHKLLYVKDKAGEVLPLTAEKLVAARQFLHEALAIPASFVKHKSFAIRTYQPVRSGAPEPLLLNSFFLGDLQTAIRLFKQQSANNNLQRYLGVLPPPFRTPLLKDSVALEQLIAPERIPPARWPGPGRHSLVLLQQAAVNAALGEVKKGDIIAVNGPPGTGKTTLLRDMMAGLITARAEAMCTFKDPATAFKESGEKILINSATLRLHKLDARLKGFEMLIASSNNKAVENVSAELPGLQAIAADAEELRYFTALSDELLGKESWGLVAAVLGNAQNRNKFREKFWWDREVGMSTYLAEAAGTEQFVNNGVDPNERHQPRIIATAHAPAGEVAARANWKAARADFEEKLNESRERLAALERIRQKVLGLSALVKKAARAKAALQEAKRQMKEAAGGWNALNTAFQQAEEAVLQARIAVAQHESLRPGFWARLFNTSSVRRWKSEREVKLLQLQLAEKKQAAAANSFHHLQRLIMEYDINHNKLEKRSKHAAANLKQAEREIEKLRTTSGMQLIDDHFFKLPHGEQHLSSPWCDPETQRLRDNVFIAAMKVHKAFIDAAAKPLKHNLGALMHFFSNGNMTDIKKAALLADLWSSLFLIVPGISTTFASVERMFRDLPLDSLGWLLIDEAGQALPQAAVGALMRTRHAVVVGDPMQIPPVVTLPEALTQGICRSLKTDPNRFNAPVASAQTLADAATCYYAEFEGRSGTRIAGMPLLVHRRCNDPMFSISNAIAYENLMVTAKRPGNSPIRDCLGASAWIQVTGTASDKWCLEEGYAVLELLGRLKQSAIPPELYIVTPFKIVADSLRTLIWDAGILNGWVDDPGKWPQERIGTVHTVQGREAEAVILVLGATMEDQDGARQWAGDPPNLLNVAVTRAKEVLYVIGNRNRWKTAGVFHDLATRVK